MYNNQNKTTTRKNIRILMALAIAVTTFAACSGDDDDNDPALRYNVAGTWLAQFDAAGIVGGGGQMEYTRLVTACTFNNDGTGTWYKFMLNNDSADPIALDGGKGHGDFTYSVATDGSITCRLKWKEAPAYYPSTLALTLSGSIITGREGTVAYEMTKASEQMKEWITYWADYLTAGDNAPRR